MSANYEIHPLKCRLNDKSKNNLLKRVPSDKLNQQYSPKCQLSFSCYFLLGLLELDNLGELKVFARESKGNSSDLNCF